MNKSSLFSRQARARARAQPQVNIVTNNKTKRCLEVVMRSVTDDLWFEIFLRLPLKDLLVSKSVSKTWLSIISSLRFVKSHLDRAIASGEDAETLIVHHNLAGEPQGYGAFSLSHLGSGVILELLDLPYSQGDYPFQRMRCNILGSECGIVCVRVDFTDRPNPIRACDIYLWNPATKLSKLVPPSIPDSFFLKPYVGFGFDHIDFDFKVVEIVSASLSAEVYSSNRNAWRKIEPKLTDVPGIQRILVCLHGFLLTPGRNGLIAFDLNKEVFVCNIKLPTDPFNTRIIKFNDSVAVSTYQNLDKKVKLWTLDDEACLTGCGVEASWTLKLSFDVGGPQFVLLAGLFNNIEFLLIDLKCDCFFYNPNKEAPGDFRGPFGYCRVFKHRKSLFPVAGSKPVKWTCSPWKLQLESDSDVENISN